MVVLYIEVCDVLGKEIKNSIWGMLAFDCVCAKMLQLCLTLCNPMDCSLPGSSVHGIFQARILEWVAISKMWKSLEEMGRPYHITCLLRKLYAGQEATVRTRHETVDWFKIGKVVHQGCILSPCLFNFYAEYIMQNAGLDETQAGIKIARRNINNLRYADDTTLMAECEEELKSLLMKMKEEREKADLKLNIQKPKIMVSGPITS